MLHFLITHNDMNLLQYKCTCMNELNIIHPMIIIMNRYFTGYEKHRSMSGKELPITAALYMF